MNSHNMKTQTTGIFTEDTRLITAFEKYYEYETFTRALLDHGSDWQKGNKIRISNLLTAISGTYKIQLLSKKPGDEPDTYEMIGCYRVMLYPSKSFSIRMRINQEGTLESMVWINQRWYLFYGIVGESEVSCRATYPCTSSKSWCKGEKEKTGFLLCQYEKLPVLESFLTEFTAHAEKRLRQSSAPGILVDSLHRYKTRIEPGENVHTYYSRLFNMLASVFFNINTGDLLSRDESQEVHRFIDHTLKDGNLFF